MAASAESCEVTASSIPTKAKAARKEVPVAIGIFWSFKRHRRPAAPEARDTRSNTQSCWTLPVRGRIRAPAGPSNLPNTVDFIYYCYDIAALIKINRDEIRQLP